MKRLILMSALILFCLTACIALAAQQNSAMPQPSPTGQAQVTVSAPPDLKWKKEVRHDLDEAVQLSAKDPVSSAILFKELARGNVKKPTPEQRAWLEQQFNALQPRAMDLLQRDYDRAAQANDLRGIIFAGAAAEQMGSSMTREPSIKEVVKRVLAGASGPAVWKFSELSANFTKGYSEGGAMAFSLLVPKGSRVLHVKTKVENSSSEPDPAYATFALGPIKRILGALSATAETQRWLDQDLLFVTTADGELHMCAAIVDGSDLAHMKMRTGGDKLIYPPLAVKGGGTVVVDAIFLVPSDGKEFNLLIPGAPPLKLSPAPES